MASIHDTPTAEDLQSDLRRQYAEFQTDPEKVIVCPWCGAFNHPGRPACCINFHDGVIRIGRDQLDSVVKQMKELKLGGKTSFACPYCGRYSRYTEHPADWPRPMQSPFCCDSLHDAVLAIAQRAKAQELIDQKNRIEDKL